MTGSSPRNIEIHEVFGLSLQSGIDIKSIGDDAGIEVPRIAAFKRKLEYPVPINEPGPNLIWYRAMLDTSFDNDKC
jgi:hypothetical protein